MGLLHSAPDFTGSCAGIVIDFQMFFNFFFDLFCYSLVIQECVVIFPGAPNLSVISSVIDLYFDCTVISLCVWGTSISFMFTYAVFVD